MTLRQVRSRDETVVSLDRGTGVRVRGTRWIGRRGQRGRGTADRRRRWPLDPGRGATASGGREGQAAQEYPACARLPWHVSRDTGRHSRGRSVRHLRCEAVPPRAPPVRSCHDASRGVPTSIEGNYSIRTLPPKRFSNHRGAPLRRRHVLHGQTATRPFVMRPRTAVPCSPSARSPA